jgi:hypothetical protein
MNKAVFVLCLLVAIGCGMSWQQKIVERYDIDLAKMLGASEKVILDKNWTMIFKYNKDVLDKFTQESLGSGYSEWRPLTEGLSFGNSEYVADGFYLKNAKYSVKSGRLFTYHTIVDFDSSQVVMMSHH